MTIAIAILKGPELLVFAAKTIHQIAQLLHIIANATIRRIAQLELIPDAAE